jgi:hypothetical protein
VIESSSRPGWFQKLFEFRCADCGSGEGIRSRPRTLLERYLLPLLLLRPIRCAECFRRDYCLILTPAKERQPEKLQKITPPTQRSSNVA